MFHVVRKSLQLVGREQRTRWIGLVVLAVLASGLEMLGALMIYLLLALVADPGAELELPLIGDIRRLAGDIDQQSLLLIMVVLMAVFFVTRAVVQVGVSYTQRRVAFRAGAHVSGQLAAGYLALPYAFHLHRNTAESIRNVKAAVAVLVTQAFLPMIKVTADLILAGSLLAVMLFVSPLATLIAVVVVGGAATVLLFVVQPRLKRLGADAHRLTQAMYKSVSQALNGLRDIKLLGRERFFADDFRGDVGSMARVSYLVQTAAELPRIVMETALVGFILVFFAYAVFAGTGTEEILSVLGLFAYAGLRLQPSLNRVISGLNQLRFASAAVDDLYDDLMMVRGSEPTDDEPPVRELRDELRIENMSFRYERAETDALTDVNLTIRAGETVGICGPTGGGKTTLVDLMTGLLEPTQGRITIDGHDLQEDVRGWQRNLGVVPQMVFLIDDTLRRNIALGVADDEIDEDAVSEAVRLAQLEEFIERAPQGLDTGAGEKGARVSGGQRQRVAIARALYRQAGVLVFDEGTSALDNTTEANLMSALARLRGEHTIILVAHRLSTVRDCDKIIYVENGRVSGAGTYDDLVSGNEGFRTLALSRQ